MSYFLPFSMDSDMDDFDMSDDPTSSNKYLNITIFVVLLVVVILYFYFFIWKKKSPSRSKNLNLDLTETDSLQIEPPAFDISDYTDSLTFEFDDECSEETCRELSCGENEILLRRTDQCCPECVDIGREVNVQDYLKRLRELNQFVDKNITKLKFNANLNDIGKNTTKVTFSLIDRLSEFNYSEFNLEEFLKIFTQEGEIIYVGIILLLFGLIFLIFSK
jgi:hypothetical protein